MKIQPSDYLSRIHQPLKELVNVLSSEFDYVSLLATDSRGKAYNVRTRSMDIRDFMGERGMVFRAIHQGRIAEFSLNQLPDRLEDAVKVVSDNLNAQFEMNKKQGYAFIPVEIPSEEEWIVNEQKSYQKPFESYDLQEKLDKLQSFVKHGSEMDPRIVNMVAAYMEVSVSKLFISAKKDLIQDYPWSQGYIMIVGKGDSGIKMAFKSASGMKGAELLDEMAEIVETAIQQLDEVLGATPIVPGEYDVICTPEITGLIAHEAFGHGVEMDMFVKNRAKAPEYMNKFVAAPILTMHDGALGPLNVSSYVFDDEGTAAHDTVVIEDGILKRGIADALSASRLGTIPTGNGKRESFERKAYTRMTSTYFSKGTDKLDDMIRSIKKGYLLDGMESGMEDPKNWGIQCVLSRGYEIIDGELTGNIVGPVILTGNVIELLCSITMISDDFELFGAGFCGKGHKEFVKTADGGAYIKAKARLG